ncbi:helix-turn-helix domain-containing protein [Patescibacteria group bacterium]|nr:helix-turn-helix domain-containing protein [Patescibacteria group bacterium]
MVKLMPDEFAPKDYFADKNVADYWTIPKGVAKCEALSWGSKMLYGVIFGLAYDKKQAFASYKTLRKHLGNPSQATLQRWLKELFDARLIRAIQRGRGATNLYRLLKSPLVGNMTDEEYALGPQVVYAGALTDEPKLVDIQEAIDLFEMEYFEWGMKSTLPSDFKLPKPYFKGRREKVNTTRSYWFWYVADKYLFDSGLALSTEFEE